MAAALERALRDAVDGEVRFSAGDRVLYAATGANYRHVPIGVVVPRTTDDIVATVALCREHDAPVLPRGAGTSLAGACSNVAVVLDCSKYLNRILDIDPVHKLALVDVAQRWLRLAAQIDAGATIHVARNSEAPAAQVRSAFLAAVRLSRANSES